MSIKGIKIFSICIIFVFVFSLSFFGFSVYKNIQAGKQTANSTLTSVIEDTTLYINHYGISHNFTQKYTEYIQNKSQLAATIILQDGVTCFAYPTSSSLMQVDNFGDPVIKGSSPIVSIFSSSLPVDNYTNLSITTAIYLITPNTIFNIAKTSFLIILGATALVFIVLILLYKKDSNILSRSETSEKKDSQNFSYDDVNPINTNYNDNLAHQSNQEKNDDKKIIEEEISENQNQQIEEEVVSSDYKALASNISDPQGLFSEHTGFGWESYFETRLDSELARSASAEQDLALFLIKIENITFQNHIIPYLTNILLDKFKFRDLIFEFGTSGFAAIVQGIDLDRAMAISQDLYTDISGLLINKQMKNKVGIGITTRSLRLITGNRLIEEASQALEKAAEEQGLPIVAFRVNPEKYRQCLVNEC